MLETEEVDVDYFTPASSTSLSKIFSNTLQTEDGQENSTLKYIPPLPTQVPPKPEEEKPTQSVLYVMTVNAYEWLKNSYVSKERIGFTIIKIIKCNLHNIILYDSNKTILSCLTLTSGTEINVKENVSISFYDNKQKYWSIYTNSNEINKILDILKGLNVCLKYPTDTENDLCKKDDIDISHRQNTSPILKNLIKNDEKESDTDSSVNRRTKDSILKRMATMGQSVLPSTHLITAQTSDSSDSNDLQSQHKSRHKQFKNTNKRNIEKHITDTENVNVLQLKTTKPLSPEISTFQNNYQTMGVKIADIIKSPGNIVSDENDITLFIPEQRVSNSELRMNMSNITQKLDLMLNKVNYLDSADRNYISNNTSHLQNEITYKLLNEYEKKIKAYEDFIKSKGFNCDTLEIINHSSKADIPCDCKQICEEKDRQINKLQEDIQLISSKLEEIELKNSNERSLTEQINDTIIPRDRTDIAQNEDVANKLKSIMNETFQTISIHFDSDTQYTGAIVKSTVASVIKKTTMNYLKDL
ncbi:uncharacterized protein LOC124539593 [Vanessa cardui]|uniref:uncharacterized protein LOC124539593 n=1 Tax=Vanessa cardui TaxID=171605 RepID=UPI001F139701|nr:uncharacterized protein LOC124539593 [Vanessa cardui]